MCMYWVGQKVRSGFSVSFWEKMNELFKPVRNRNTQQEVSGVQRSQVSSAASHRSYYHLNHPPASPCPWKNYLPRNRSLVPKRLGTTALGDPHYLHFLTVKTASLNSRLPGRQQTMRFKRSNRLCYLSTVWPWASALTSLYVSFFL